MTILSPARRVASFDDIERAGDYSGPHPVIHHAGTPAECEVPTVWFLLPVHAGDGPLDHGGAPGNGMHAVTSPPWAFRECPDGSLEISGSAGCGHKPYYWHGYLDEGSTWRQVDV